MSPASMTAPPCGAIASPQTVMMSDVARGGDAASSRRIQRRTCGWGAAVRVGVRMAGLAPGQPAT